MPRINHRDIFMGDGNTEDNYELFQPIKKSLSLDDLAFQQKSSRKSRRPRNRLNDKNILRGYNEAE